ncbi:MAG: hypothetical protein ACFB4I_16190 [Cyanophyceae cyanobacterium]
MLGAIAGDVIGSVYYGKVPEAIAQQTLNLLDEPLRLVTQAFMDKYWQPS